MFRSLTGKRLCIAGGVFLALLLSGVVLVNGRVTNWINGEGFRELLNKETSKGLKLEANYSPLVRTGLLGTARRFV